MSRYRAKRYGYVEPRDSPEIVPKSTLEYRETPVTSGRKRANSSEERDGMVASYNAEQLSGLAENNRLTGDAAKAAPEAKPRPAEKAATAAPRIGEELVRQLAPGQPEVTSKLDKLRDKVSLLMKGAGVVPQEIPEGHRYGAVILGDSTLRTAYSQSGTIAHAGRKAVLEKVVEQQPASSTQPAESTQAKILFFGGTPDDRRKVALRIQRPDTTDLEATAATETVNGIAAEGGDTIDLPSLGGLVMLGTVAGKRGMNGLLQDQIRAAAIESNLMRTTMTLAPSTGPDAPQPPVA